MDPVLPRDEGATAEMRRKQEQDRLTDMEKKAFEEEKVSSLSDLQTKLRHCTTLPSGFTEMSTNDCISYVIIDLSDQPTLLCSVTFFGDLTGSVVVDKCEVPTKAYKHLLTHGIVTSECQAVNILAFAKSSSEQTTQDTQYLLENAISCLSKYSESCDESSKINFLIEQIRLLTMSKHHRSYSPSLLVTASTWNSISPRCYKQILQDDILILPSLSTLYRISSVLSVQASSNETRKYLDIRIKKMDEKERCVILMIDEMYVQKAVEYSGGKFFGSVGCKPAKTILSFMIKSLHHRHQDVVALFPTSDLTAGSLHQYFLEVNRLLLSVGFTVVALSLDNASVNRSFYSKLCGGHLTSNVPNPHNGDPLFLIFDPTHLFKKFYNNFQRRKHFICPQFENDPEFCPSFDHIEELYQLERNRPSSVKLS